ncbi:septum formation family protein [Pseudarthrobacter sp. L1SW]|uniref:septum formation family protein n=1 Tax=Pseudarthrobacter sp. L1SW TaxID=2851598 RepID=UPI001E398D64|nr:septum formation family protein [Pseudarthrobacter sp. L1SW]UEL28241.1 septum formation family protein [Pseudarthrobacter sp. L1SW]
MNNQDVPPRPSSPPTAGLPRVPAPAAQPVLHPHIEPQDGHAPGPGPVKRRTLWIAFFVAVLLAVIGSLVWLALWLDSNPDTGTSRGPVPGVLETAVTPPATPLPLPREGVPPADYALGDCFKDFDPESLSSTVVPCDTGHSAQLVALFRYPEGGSYPGAEALKAKALEACQAARLGPAANDYDLNYERSFPSTTSWESGDRRVDCYVTAPGGNVINASVLP